MYRRSDPRWNRTLQHITENLEHANDTAQENIYGFTQRYIDPCFSSITQCVNACTAPCFPQHNDRRRHRGRARGRAEPSFDFYDDWEDDENDGLLGWGSDNLERFLGASANYGATAQPGRQRAMSYGQRNRDARYNTPRRKSGTVPRDGAQDPTLIPSSSYFGFLGRLPFNIGGKGLRYKPSAADLIEHPGASRRSVDEEQPLIDDSDDDGPEHKGHRRQRSDTHTSGHTTDSLSSRGDIFPSEDELEDAVPLDDEFTMALERRTTGQWNEDGASSNKSRSGKSQRPSASRLSTRTTQHSSPSATTDEIPTLADLHAEEERLRLQEEKEVDRKRHEAHNLAVKRGLAVDSADASPRHKEANHNASISPSSSSPTQMATLQSTLSPLALAPRANTSHDQLHYTDTMPSPSLVDAQTMPDSGAFYVNDSDYGSNVATPQRPLSLRNEQRDATQSGEQGEQALDEFVPARLPHFGSG